MRKNIIAISIIGILFLSSFTIVSAGSGSVITIIISNVNPANESKEVDLNIPSVSVDIEVNELNGAAAPIWLPFHWKIGGNNITTGEGDSQGPATVTSAIIGPLESNMKINWYVNVTVADKESIFKNETFSFITYNKPPVANFTNTMYGLKVDFNGASSYDLDGKIANYTWYFGDGSKGYESKIQHIFYDNLTYYVSLNVTDDGGKSDNKTIPVTVKNAAPVADFKYSINGKKVTFDASLSSDKDGTIENYTWNFGDIVPPSEGYGKLINHTYIREGETYLVSLKATDNKGNSSIISKNIKINDTTKPTVEIVKPLSKGIYVNNELKRSKLLGMTLIVGDITIQVNSTDINGSGIAKVDFFVNGRFKGNDTMAPYSYNLTKDRIIRFIHIEIIKVVAYDNAGNSATAKMIARKIL